MLMSGSGHGETSINIVPVSSMGTKGIDLKVLLGVLCKVLLFSKILCLGHYLSVGG